MRPSWKSLLAVLGWVVGIGLAVFFWLSPREPASMAFTYGTSDVVTAKGPEAERFEINWRGERVRNAVLVLVRFTNSGG